MAFGSFTHWPKIPQLTASCAAIHFPLCGRRDKKWAGKQREAAWGQVRRWSAFFFPTSQSLPPVQNDGSASQTEQFSSTGGTRAKRICGKALAGVAAGGDEPPLCASYRKFSGPGRAVTFPREADWKPSWTKTCVDCQVVWRSVHSGLCHFQQAAFGRRLLASLNVFFPPPADSWKLNFWCLMWTWHLVVYFVPNTFHTQRKFALVTKDITIQYNATPQT